MRRADFKTPYVNFVHLTGYVYSQPYYNTNPESTPMVNFYLATQTRFTDRNTGTPKFRREYHHVMGFAEVANAMNNILRKLHVVSVTGKIVTNLKGLEDIDMKKPPNVFPGATPKIMAERIIVISPCPGYNFTKIVKKNGYDVLIPCDDTMESSSQMSGTSAFISPDDMDELIPSGQPEDDELNHKAQQ